MLCAAGIGISACLLRQGEWLLMITDRDALRSLRGPTYNLGSPPVSAETVFRTNALLFTGMKGPSARLVCAGRVWSYGCPAGGFILR